MNQTNKLVVEAWSVDRDAEFPYFAVIAVTPKLLAEAERVHRIKDAQQLLEAAVQWPIGWELGWVAGSDHRTAVVERKSFLVARASGILFRLDEGHHCVTREIPLAVLHQAAQSADAFTYHGHNINELRALLAA